MTGPVHFRCIDRNQLSDAAFDDAIDALLDWIESTPKYQGVREGAAVGGGAVAQAAPPGGQGSLIGSGLERAALASRGGRRRSGKPSQRRTKPTVA